MIVSVAMENSVSGAPGARTGSGLYGGASESSHTPLPEADRDLRPDGRKIGAADYALQMCSSSNKGGQVSWDQYRHGPLALIRHGLEATASEVPGITRCSVCQHGGYPSGDDPNVLATAVENP